MTRQQGSKTVHSVAYRNARWKMAARQRDGKEVVRYVVFVGPTVRREPLPNREWIKKSERWVQVLPAESPRVRLSTYLRFETGDDYSKLQVDDAPQRKARGKTQRCTIRDRKIIIWDCQFYYLAEKELKIKTGTHTRTSLPVLQ